jgi:hypothetical protein
MNTALLLVEHPKKSRKPWTHPLRTLYAFDPRRSAILLIGGDKTGNDRWYDIHIPIADRLYDGHLEQLRKEGLIDG